LIARYCCIIGVSFSVALLFAAAALISFGTVVMGTLFDLAEQVQGQACHFTAIGHGREPLGCCSGLSATGGIPGSTGWRLF
jgi:hypothetical protein